MVTLPASEITDGVAENLHLGKTAVHRLATPAVLSALVYIGCAAALGRRYPLYSLIGGQRS